MNQITELILVKIVESKEKDIYIKEIVILIVSTTTDHATTVTGCSTNGSVKSNQARRRFEFKVGVLVLVNS